MGLNPDTNKFENLREPTKEEMDRLVDPAHHPNLVRPDGQPIPLTWAIFQIGELVVIKNYTFKVAYIGETMILFEPVRIIVKMDE